MGSELCSPSTPVSISHLEEVSEAGVSAMARAGACAVILPTTAYILRLRPPPARQLVDAGVVVALGSDFNPNAFCLSMVSEKKCLYTCRYICLGLSIEYYRFYELSTEAKVFFSER